MTSVNYSDLEMALDFVSGDGGEEHAAYVSRETGAIFWVAEDGPLGEEVPDDVGDRDRYAPVPRRRELDLGKPLVMRFADVHLSEHYEAVRECFRGRGAYARFQDLLVRYGRIEQWYAFEADATKQALLEWCREQTFDLVVGDA
jgi:hypothetical protein